MTKSKDCKLDLVKGQASRPYKRIGRHLLLTKYGWGWVKIGDFRPVSLYISEIVQDMDTVTLYMRLIL